MIGPPRKAAIQLASLVAPHPGIDQRALAVPSGDIAGYSRERLVRSLIGLLGVGSPPNGLVPAWQTAIPNPYKYYTSIAGFFPPVADWAAWHAPAWNLCPAGLYVMPVTTTYATAPHRTVSAASRSYEWEISQGPVFYVSPAAGSPTDDIELTVTIGGTGGYTCTRRMLRGFSPLAQVYTVPEPWDEERTVEATWTGGGTTATLTSLGWRSVVPVLTEVPTGWTLNPWTGKSGSPAGQVYTPLHHIRKSESVIASGSFIQHYASNNSQLAHRAPRSAHADETDWSRLVGSLSEWFDANAPDGRSRQPVLAGEEFAPHAGFPVPVSGAWHRSLISPESDTLVTADSSWRYYRIRSLDKLILALNLLVSTSVTVEVGHNADWSGSPTGTAPDTSDYSGTWSHGGTGLEFFDAPVTPWTPHTDGSKPAMIAIRSSVSCSAFLRHAPMPSPVTMGASDGTVIPGAYHEDSLEPMGGLQIVDGAYPSVDFADIPADVKAFAVRITDVPDGYYRVRQLLAGGTDHVAISPWWGTTPVGRYDVSTPAFVTTGEVYAQSPVTTSQWGNYGKSASSSRVLDRIELTEIPISHNALSLGDNELATSQATWGIGGSYFPTNYPLFFFQSFTAPSAGRYRFRVSVPEDSSFINNDNLVRLGVWASTTDSMCSHPHPDYTEAAGGQYSLGFTRGPAGTPPTSAGSAGYAVYLITGASGDWAGLDGYVASGIDRGFAGAVCDWRLSNPPNGTVARATISSVTKGLVKVDGDWVVRAADLVDFSVDLANGQTIYLRIGNAPNVLVRPQPWGYGLPVRLVGTSATNSVIMNVSAV